MSSVATDGKDGHGLKVVKVGNTFSSFNALLAKIINKKYWLVFPDETSLTISSYLYRSIFVCG